MAFSLKKVLKKVEKTVKKVAAPVISTFNPALGSFVASAQKAYAKAKGDVGVIAQGGIVGNSGVAGDPEALTAAYGPAYPGSDNAAARARLQGDFGMGLAGILKGKNSVLLAVAVGVVLLVLMLRRK